MRECDLSSLSLLSSLLSPLFFSLSLTLTLTVKEKRERMEVLKTEEAAFATDPEVPATNLEAFQLAIAGGPTAVSVHAYVFSNSELERILF